MRLFEIQSTPDNLNLQGKLKKVRVIGSSSYRELEKKGGGGKKGKKQFLINHLIVERLCDN